MPFISRKTLDEFRATHDTLVQELNKVKQNAYLISIEREGRENVFTFARGESVYQIRTMGLLSDNLPEWKENLLR